MSERERWIIYPLLFFALGAGIRDKILQRVEVKEIFCESLRIIDHQDPDRALAELSFRRLENNDLTHQSKRLGQLRLFDSDERKICDMSSDMVVDRLIACKSLRIFDEEDPNKPLAELSFRKKNSRDPSQLADRVGHLRLVDSDGRDVCNLTNDVFVDRMVARQVLVVDPSRRPLVLVGTEAVPGVVSPTGDEAVSYQGVIYLNNRPLGTGIRLAPPATRKTSPSPSPPIPAPSSSP